MIDLTFTPLTWFILLGFAVFRLGWLFAREDGPFAVFLRMRMVLNSKAARVQPQHYNLDWTLAELANCPLCLGIWIGLLAIIAVTIPGIVLKIIILWLAVAGFQSFLTLLIIKDE